VGALATGLGWCVLRYILSPTVTNTRQLNQELELPVFGSVSNTLTVTHVLKRSFQLTTFLSVLLMLALIFALIFWFRDPSSEILRDWLTHHNLADFIRQIKSATGIGN
jgi:hypothetical protein